MTKCSKNGFFNEASAKLRRPNERVFQMFMNMMKNIKYDYTMTAVEATTVHNYAFMNR